MTKETQNKYKIPLKHQICAEVSFTNRYNMPIIQPYLGEIPKKVLSFNRARAHTPKDAAVHFYVADVFFECVWNRPEVYLPRLQEFPFVISTDFSLYSDMLAPEVIWNTFRNKLLCAWWQKHGVNVIPNISWGREWSYDFVLEGYPKDSIIAINSTGIGTDKIAKKLWLNGYQRILKDLRPIHILRYGAAQDGEDMSISTFYKNDNFNGAVYGRQWFL